ncbi:putative splicing factor 3b subunit 1 [Favolaschia claudopus]|uniref:Splicing factor 3b subunit 1 n=1 Tax=Favolaschia claudopus TaxID=2862362 RepID=A0AAW0C2C4_9AGAR
MSCTPANFLDSYTAPKEVLDEFRDLVENQDVDPLDSHRIGALTERHGRLLTQTLRPVDDAGDYRTAMRLAHIEGEEKRVKDLIAAKESMKMDVDVTPRTVDTPDIPDPSRRKRKWDVAGLPFEEATHPKRRSRWDVTQADVSAMTPIIMNPICPSTKPMEDLDDFLPSDGYLIFLPSELNKTSVWDRSSPKFFIQESVNYHIPDLLSEIPAGFGNLAHFKPEDREYFSQLLKEEGTAQFSVDELKERKVLSLLFQIKNGTPPIRKSALRQITKKAREFGAPLLFDKILPLLMERASEDHERHLLVKVLDRVLWKLDDMVRPYIHRILVVIQPLLIDEDFYARAEGRELISNLAKAAGLAHMISAMRPDIDHTDEFVRNTTARAFAVVASALGIQSLLPFIKAVCHSRKSWQARHTGSRIVQQIALLMGAAVLPHLGSLVDCISSGLTDEQQKVRIVTALALAALADAAAPYGIESFGGVMQPLWSGLRTHRGKALAAFLKAVGFIIPLMDTEYAASSTKHAMDVLVREFKTSDEEMKRIVLKVVQQCVGTEGVTSEHVEKDNLPHFFAAFWTRRMALDRRNYKQVVDTTVALAKKAGALSVVDKVVDGLKDESEPFRKMSIEAISAIVAALGVSGVNERTEARLVDGVLYAFQEQTTDDYILLDGFGVIVNALGVRSKPYLTQIISTILWRLNNKSAKVRQQAADLTLRLVVVIKLCGEEQMLSKLGLVLFEQLGEEYPDTLGSIVAALGAVANTLGMVQINPPVKDLVCRLMPILRNRHEKVQEEAINFIGRIADRGAEFVPAREWMRICFELLDLVKARRKNIRRAAVNTFGYIAKSIGPQDVISVLLTNLRVQDRQSRVCSSIAIAIVAETCGAFTCIPAILNEYRTAELNVRTGCLKALTFVFEYIGPQSAFYCDSVLSLLEDALTDRDAVHRQTACVIVKHLALGVAGMGHEDAMMHLLNLVWPNCFETAPHVISAVLSALEAMQVALGPGVLSSYLMQGLFHPARKVREVYWRIYGNLYCGAQDAMVPFHPDLGQLGYRRDVLQFFV